MAQSYIYMVDPDGSLRRMEPSPPETEDRMQALVARYPELISDGDGDLLLIRRGQSIADNDEGSGRWSLDHLFVTRDALPVLVELKRSVDFRLRREVVGQMLDYAANATAYWQAGRIADSFASTAAEAGADAEAALSDFIGDQDPTTFWNQVDANFKAGRIKLVFVADEIPRELARIVEFLNDQMRADVRAVELRWFTGRTVPSLSALASSAKLNALLPPRRYHKGSNRSRARSGCRNTLARPERGHWLARAFTLLWWTNSGAMPISRLDRVRSTPPSKARTARHTIRSIFGVMGPSHSRCAICITAHRSRTRGYDGDCSMISRRPSAS